MHTARFALGLGLLAVVTAATTIGMGCSGAESSGSVTTAPTNPRDGDEDDGDITETAPKDAGGGKDSGGPRHDGGSLFDAETTATCATNGAKALSIDPNHGAPHGLVDLPAGDFAATSTDDKDYSLTPGGGGGGGGSGQHTHAFTLSGAERAKLSRGEAVAKVTTPGGNNAHTHTVTLGCK